jgi:hypothetical protein
MSGWHPSEEELVLRYYGDAEDRPDIDGHLEGCPECTAAFRGLTEALRLVPAEDVPSRDDAYGQKVWERVRPRLGADAPLGASRSFTRRSGLVRRVLPSHLGAWGALAASLLLAFWLGLRFPGTAPAAPVVRERILLVAVGDHLERSRMVLAEISNASASGPTGLQAEQRWAGSLVAENRMYRQAAMRAGDTSVANVLDELERVLAELANGPEELKAKQIEDLQARIEARGLLFKVKVVEGQVRARARRVTTPKEMM